MFPRLAEVNSLGHSVIFSLHFVRDAFLSYFLGRSYYSILLPSSTLCRRTKRKCVFRQTPAQQRKTRRNVLMRSALGAEEQGSFSKKPTIRQRGPSTGRVAHFLPFHSEGIITVVILTLGSAFVTSRQFLSDLQLLFFQTIYFLRLHLIIIRSFCAPTGRHDE